MLESALILVLLLFAVVAARLLRGMGPIGYWIAGWSAAAIAGAVSAGLPTLTALQLAVQPIATLSAALLLAGTLLLVGRPVPRWWLPAALGFGLLRAAAALLFGPRAGYALGLACEPVAVFAAAFVAWRFARQPEATLAERLLGPAMAVLGVAGGYHLLSLARGNQILLLVPLWLTVAPVVLCIQIQAAGDQLRRALRRVLEERVAARTLELAESEERYRTISELASDFAFKLRFDRAGNLARDWTAGAFEATLGWRPEDVDGRGWIRLLESGAREQMADEYRRIAAGEAIALERRLVGSDGKPRWIQLRLARVQMNAAGEIEVLGSARDVTELKRAEQESERLRRHVEQVERLESLGILAGGIAHDFNNLLTVIRGSARLALDALPAGAPARVRVERILEAAQHAAALTDQMLTYAGKSAATRSPLDLGALVDSMAELLRASVPERCEVVFETGEPLPPIDADANGIRQVLLNLVLNAAEAARGGRVRILVRTAVAEISRDDLRDAFGNPDIEPGAVVELSVRDDGCGMDAATAARVFEPFFTTKFSGRGLGMAAVLGVVQAHRGAICIDSELGKGTCVRALFPPTAARPAASAARTVPATRRSGGTVLIVDDDAGVLELAGEVVARAGFRVLTARGGHEALARVREVGAAQVDVVVLDLAMPDMSGEETFLRLRELRGDLPVILVSGHDAARVADRFAARGLDAFLRKPWEPEELVASLEQVLRR